MKPQTLHAHEDRLLDFVYGELPPLEARAVQSHVDGCPRCSELLAGMRGVRTTMAQLPMEPAPDAGLESLLAYANQAARNAAAGPPPKPTWWRRWLMPAMGVTAVSVFGIVSIQVNKAVDLKEEVAAQSVAKSAEDYAPASPVKSPEPTAALSPEPSQERAPVNLPPAAMQKVAPKAQRVQPTPVPAPDTARAGAGPEQEEEGAYQQGMTPPPPAPAAKLDSASVMKESPRKKPLTSGSRDARSDWSNTGAGAGLGDTKDAAKGSDDLGEDFDRSAEKKAKQGYSYDRRDAMTQSGAFSKPKPILVAPGQAGTATAEAPAPAEPSAPSAQPPMEEAAADGLMAESEAQVQQQAPSSGGLSLNRGRSNETAANKPSASTSRPAAAEDDFDDLFGAKESPGKREQKAPSTAAAPPPPAPAAVAPMPSVSTTPPAKTVARAEPRGKSAEASPAELSKQADAALRADDRIREVQLLRQALAVGATGGERLRLLDRLCDAEFAIGRRLEAQEACNQVLEEGPRSNAAQMARGRLRKQGLEADDAKPGTGSRGPLKAAPADKMEAPVSAPTQLQ
ncbi:zf-HC2 domain-containing protein [Hyalangium sp.]|uniref:zf-HC2 domain-containing protein n=1 Tax=Hyalangium sp. TaxID=2028555 RepID=UPI002D31DB67|nr:zf-HC2 domain-containing protein [Hyalangium sp.]HYH99136.1 zf-HC2 domain-containing protein [Hyalangium sp.]